MKTVCAGWAVVVLLALVWIWAPSAQTTKWGWTSALFFAVAYILTMVWDRGRP